MAGAKNLQVELIFVNDGSHDDSLEALASLARQDSRVKVINFSIHCGLTASIKAGIDYSSGAVIVTMDGKLQNDPNDIPRMLEKLAEGWDVCSGWRQEPKDRLLKRDLPNRITNFIISKVSGIKLHDHGSALKAYRRAIIKDVKLYGEMHKLLPVYASWQGGRVTEIVITQHPRSHGYARKQNGIKRIVKTTLDLLLVQFLSRYTQRPMYIFGLFGFINFLTGIVAAYFSIYYKLSGEKSFIETPLPLITVVCTVTGGLAILMGFLAEILTRIYFETQGRAIYRTESLVNLNKHSHH